MRTITLAPALVALVACTPKLSEEDADDLAQATAPLMQTSGTGAAAAYEDSVQVATATGAFVQDASGSFTSTLGSLSFSWSVDCFDDADAAVDCGDTTQSADIAATLDGSLDTTIYDLTIARQADWSIDGVGTGVVTLDGTASTSLESSFTALFRDVQRTYDLDLDGAWSLSGDATAQTVTGTIGWDVVADRTRTEDGQEAAHHVETTIDVTFLGDGTADVLIGGTYTYTVDLATGQVTN